MIVPAAVLAVAAIVVGLLPHLGGVLQAAAVRFQDQSGYAGTVLSGVQVTHPAAVYPAEPSGVTLAGVLSGAASAAGGLVLAGLALYWRRIPCCAAAPGPTWCWPARSSGSRAGWSTTTSRGSSSG